ERQNLIRKRVHAGTRLTTSNRTEYSHTGVETALWDGKPTRCFGWLAFPCMVNLSDDNNKVGARGGARVGRQLREVQLPFLFNHENVCERKQERQADVWSCEEHGRVCPLHSFEDGGALSPDQ